MNRQKTYNIELFWRVILGQKNLRNLRMPITCFITAESLEDRTSWRKIQYSTGREVIFKYESQMEDAFQNQALWQQQPAPCRPAGSAMLRGMGCSSAAAWFASHGGEENTPSKPKTSRNGIEKRFKIETKESKAHYDSPKSWGFRCMAMRADCLGCIWRPVSPNALGRSARLGSLFVKDDWS